MRNARVSLVKSVTNKGEGENPFKKENYIAGRNSPGFPY